MQDILVSIVVPSYKRHLETLRAVRSALNQSYQNIEIIVVDDNGKGSSNQIETERALSEVISKEKVTYIPLDFNRGGNYARNVGVKFSRGQYVCFLDSDDEFLPEKVERQLEALLAESSEKCFAITCNTYRAMFGKVVNASSNKGKGDFTSAILKQRLRLDAGSTLLIRKDKLLEVGGFDEELKRHQELEFLIRYFSKYELMIHEGVLAKIHIDDRSNIPDPDVFSDNKSIFLDKISFAFSSRDSAFVTDVFRIHNLEIVKVCLRKRHFFKALKKMVAMKATPMDYCRLLMEGGRVIWTHIRAYKY